MKPRLTAVAVLIVILFAAITPPPAYAIDLEPGECYEYTRYSVNACGGYSYVTYQTRMDEFGVLHTVIIRVGSWCQ